MFDETCWMNFDNGTLGGFHCQRLRKATKNNSEYGQALDMNECNGLPSNFNF